jgi:hypothetical protein
MSTNSKGIDLGAGRRVSIERIEPDGGEPRIRIDLLAAGQRTGNRLVLSPLHAEQLARHVLNLTRNPEPAP